MMRQSQSSGNNGPRRSVIADFLLPIISYLRCRFMNIAMHIHQRLWAYRGKRLAMSSVACVQHPPPNPTTNEVMKSFAAAAPSPSTFPENSAQSWREAHTPMKSSLTAEKTRVKIPVGCVCRRMGTNRKGRNLIAAAAVCHVVTRRALEKQQLLTSGVIVCIHNYTGPRNPTILTVFPEYFITKVCFALLRVCSREGERDDEHTNTRRAHTNTVEQRRKPQG